jgi:hypothetical protein
MAVRLVSPRSRSATLEAPRLRRAAAGLGGLLGALAWLVSVAPALLAFACAVAAAVGWSIWLDRHPES